MTVKKTFQELGYQDAFLFALTMEDEEICRGVLERVLEIPVRSVKVRSENAFLINSDYRGIRMDVFADDEDGTVYNVEMQTANRGNLPERSRFYQSQMDAGLLKPGEDFRRLPESYVIFLCTFDPFGRGRCRYTFEEICLEDGERLGDGSCKVFLNAHSVCGEQESPELMRFLSYVSGRRGDADCGLSEDPLIRQIDARIASLKRNRGMEVQYMLFSEMLSDERKDGYDDGYKKGEKKAESRLLQLIGLMNREGLGSETPRLESDPDFLQEMYKRFHLDK